MKRRILATPLEREASSQNMKLCSKTFRLKLEEWNLVFLMNGEET